MKKLPAMISALVCVLCLAGCGESGEVHEIEITVPAGSTDTFVYSDEEISPQGDTLKITTGAGIASAKIILKPVDAGEENAYEPEPLKQGEPVIMAVEKDAWFKIGIAVQNPSDRDILTAVKVENVQIRIE